MKPIRHTTVTAGTLRGMDGQRVRVQFSTDEILEGVLLLKEPTQSVWFRSDGVTDWCLYYGIGTDPDDHSDNISFKWIEFLDEPEADKKTPFHSECGRFHEEGKCE